MFSLRAGNISLTLQYDFGFSYCKRLQSVLQFQTIFKTLIICVINAVLDKDATGMSSKFSYI